MRYTSGFKIAVLPKYTGEDPERGITDNLAGQRALWSALHLLMVLPGQRSVELRFVSDANDRSLSVYLLLISHGEAREDDEFQIVGRLLPKDYVWNALDRDELAAAVEPRRRGREPWRITRVVRRLHYIDLPSYLPPGDAAPGADVSSAGARFRFAEAGTEDCRRLPDDLNDFRSEIESTRFCLPLMSPLEEYPSTDRRQLWEELQAAAPAVISLTLHGFPSDALAADRQVATRFRGFVDYLGGALANSGFAHFQGLRSVFDRFFLTGAHLGMATIRVAATSDVAVLGVSHQLCAWLGAMRTFAVVSPTRNFDRLESRMSDPGIDFPVGEDSPGWEASIRRLGKILDAENVDDPDDPRYSKFLVRLPHVYSIEEASLLMRLPFGFEPGLPGFSTQMVPPFTSGPARFDPVVVERATRPAAKDRIRIGRISARTAMVADGRDDGLHWHTISPRDLTKHALIVGSTGSGKTVTTMFLMRELLRLDIPFLVIEPVKTEYFTSLKDLPDFTERRLQRFRLEGSRTGRPAVDFLAFDPLRLQKSVTVSRHVSYLKSCFEAAFPMEAWQSLFLENGLLDYYLAGRELGGCGLSLFSRGGTDTLRIETSAGKAPQVFPSFNTFSAYFLGTFLERELARPDSGKPGARPPSSDRIEEFRQLFKRRFENLGRGPVGEMFRQADLTTIKFPAISLFSRLLTSPTVIELDAIPDGDQKALVMAFLMTFLYERRQVDDLVARETEKPMAPGLRHVVVIEEAHRLLANPSGGRRGDSVGMDSKAKAVSLFVDMLAEIRAFGQGLVIVEQIPTKLVPEAVKNTNLKVMLRLTARDDRDFLGEAMSFNEEQKRFVSTLRAEPGKQVQFVAFDESVDQPVLLSLPLRPGREDSDRLFDEYFSEGHDS